MYYKKAPQNRERGHEKKRGKKYKESKMIMAESLNSTTVYDWCQLKKVEKKIVKTAFITRAKILQHKTHINEHTYASPVSVTYWLIVRSLRLHKNHITGKIN